MSYDLTFIKYNKKPRMEANKMYEILMAREIVAGLEVMDANAIKKVLIEAFADWTISDGTILDMEKGEQSFQVTFDKYYVRTDFYGNSKDVMDKVRWIMSSQFGCHMYDSGLNVIREVIDGKSARDRIHDIRSILTERLEKTGYKAIESDRFLHQTNDAELIIYFQMYEQNHVDRISVRPTFYLRYPKLNESVVKIRGKETFGANLAGPTAMFAITEASEKIVKDPCYSLKNGEDVYSMANTIISDIEKYVFPIFEKADSIEKYEELFKDKSIKAIRPPVALREYFQIAMALINHGSIDDKVLTKLLLKAEKNDVEYNSDCVERIKNLLCVQ